MEILAVILLLIFWQVAVKIVFTLPGALFRTLTGKGSFKENFGVGFNGMSNFEVRGHNHAIPADGEGEPLQVIEMQGRGLMPVTKSTDISFITSIMDKTDGELKPVISALEAFQEPTSKAFQHTIEAGTAKPDQGYISWVKIGAVLPLILVPPIGGNRKLVAITRVIDNKNPPEIDLGFSNGKTGILGTYTYEFDYFFKEKGYEEKATNKHEAKTLGIMTAVHIAMADGEIADAEGSVIQDWIKKTLATYSGTRREELKDAYNTAFKDAYGKAKSGSLSLGALTEKINEIADKADKYEIIDLCFDVMAADGIAEEGELKAIKNIAEALDLNYDEIQKMKDQRLVKLSTQMEGQANLEAILGIDPEWPKEKIQKHLRTEFTKWNGRLNTLTDPQERENAQLMLNRIAEARKKYGS